LVAPQALELDFNDMAATLLSSSRSGNSLVESLANRGGVHEVDYLFPLHQVRQAGWQKVSVAAE
jgi:hypothetical protein